MKLRNLIFADESEKPVYHATPIAKDQNEHVEEKKRSKPKLEYLPLPIKAYIPTAINNKRDSYTPEVTSNQVAHVSYIPSKIQDPEEEPKKVEEKKSEYKSSRSSSSSHKKSSSKDRHRSSSNSHRSSSSHKSSSSSRHKSSSHHHKSSSSSNGHKHKHKSKERDRSKEKESKKRKTEEKPEEIEPLDDLPSDVDMDDDDIEAQCRMIFENYEPEEQIEIKQPTKSTATDTSVIAEVGKKRQAHENANSIQKPVTVRQNHSQTAMVTAQRRQEVAIQMALTEKKAREEEIAKLQADIKEKESEMETKTPLVNPLMFVRPPKRMIAPISQRMAIEAAKRKVMELNKTKESPYRQTAAQTASKSGRVAHVPSLSDLDATKLAPPILEIHQTKISSNVRTQMYKLMVKHCIEIYLAPADAFSRAQNEEFEVFKKCSLVSIYKTSAMLAINRLKKEAEACGTKNKVVPKTISHELLLAGPQGQKHSWSTDHKKKIGNSNSSLLTIDNCSGSQAYNLVAECVATEQQMKENGYPRTSEIRGKAQFFVPQKKKPQSAREGSYYCSRCQAIYNVEIYDEHHVDLCELKLIAALIF